MKIVLMIISTLVVGICGDSFLDFTVNSNRFKKNNLKTHDHFVGGVNKADPNDKRLRVYLQDALEELNAGEIYNYEAIKIFDATRQLVAGDLYKFRVAFKVGEDFVTCAFEVWEQEWIEYGREVSITCDNQKRLTFKQKPIITLKYNSKL